MSGCTGPCQQGRAPCPAPEACGLSEPDGAQRALYYLAAIVCVVCALAGMVLCLVA